MKMIFTRETNRGGLQLLPNGLTCQVYDGDGHRFVRLFREAWRHVPAPAKRRITRYWNAPIGPRMELIRWWSGHLPRVMGQVSLLGRQVRFHAPYIDRASDADVRYVIAHELAHVLQWANGSLPGQVPWLMSGSHGREGW
jgi:hypothetical protein